MRPSYVLWLLTAVALLAMTTQAAHVREASSSSLASNSSSSINNSNKHNNYENDPRPDAVNEEASDILGTGGAYKFRLPQPQINKQQLQQKQQQQNQHKTKRPNTTATYITTTKTSSTSSNSNSKSGNNSSSTASIFSPMMTKSTTTRPSSSTAIKSGQKIANGTSLTAVPAQSIQQSNLMDNNLQANYQSITMPVVVANDATEKDSDLSKKIIGTSVVTSVSVVLNGNEPEFTDALGHKLPKPQGPLHVASPIDLLNPDRYEFYTFDENGDLVKRLMTMEEIQSIVANGDGENSPIVQYTPVDDRSEPEKNVQDIVDSVQNVLNKEVESNKNVSKDSLPTLDTPDVTSSWSIILPAIFGNGAGGSSDLFLQQKPQQILMTPDSEVLETSTSSSVATAQHTSKRPKPSKRKPGQKRKPTTVVPMSVSTASTAMTPQVVQEELGPDESVYTGMQQYQNTAANMQHFDGFSQLQMQPIYHKLPDQSTPTEESTTRRIFVNNQEVVESEKTTRPTMVEDEKVELNEDFAKRPTTVVGAHYKRPALPHSNKTPNGSNGDSNTTKKPQGVHDKQKIKKKPTAASATTTTTPEPTTTKDPSTTTTTTLEPTATTTTTTPEPEPVPVTTIAPESATSSTTTKPSATTPKKKKKPTRQPGQGTSNKPYPVGEKRKPGTGKPSTGKPRPTGAAQHNVHKQQQQSVAGIQHHSTSYVSTTKPSAVEPAINKHSSTISHKPNRTRPRPHKKPTPATSTTTTTTTESTTTTTTMTPEPITPETTAITTAAPSEAATNENTLIVEHFPGHPPIHVKHTYISKRPGVSNYPVPVYNPTDHKVEVADAADLGKLKRKPLPSLSQIQQNLKPAEKPILLEDHQTLTSFDQIMESLKVELGDKMDEDINEASASEKRPMVEKPSKVDVEKAPATYASDTLSKETNEAALSAPLEPEIINDKFTTDLELISALPPPTLAATSEEISKKTTMSTTHEDTTEEFTEDPEDSADTTNVSVYSTEEYVATLDNKNGVLILEPLYADVKEPVLTDIATTAETFLDETTTPLDEENNTEDGAVEESGTEVYFAGTMKSPVTNTIDTLIAEGKLTTSESQPQVADLKPHLNMDIIKPSSQINMSDFQTQAATVASALVDGGNSYELASSNDTRSELDFLISDVLQEIAEHESDDYRVESVGDGNRFTNFAQLNSSFLLKPTQSTKINDGLSNSDSIYVGSTTTTIPLKESTVELNEALHEEEHHNKLDTATQILTYATKDDIKQEDQNTVEATAEKPDKEHKAELSEEILETKETMHKIEWIDKDNYEVHENTETQTTNFEKDNEKLDENPLAQLDTTEQYDIEITTVEYPDKYKTTTQEQQSFEGKKESDDKLFNKTQIRIESDTTESLSEAETITAPEELSSEESAENKKDETKSAEEIITEIEKINDAETAKINEENDNKRRDSAEKEESQKFGATTDEHTTQTEHILLDEVTEIGNLLEENSTEQSTDYVKQIPEEEENGHAETKVPLQEAENFASSIQETNEKENDEKKTQVQAAQLQDAEETPTSLENVENKKHEEITKGKIQNKESETKISSIMESINNSNEHEAMEKGNEENDDEAKENITLNEEIEKETSKKEAVQSASSENNLDEEKIYDKKTDNEETNEKQTNAKNTNDGKTNKKEAIEEVVIESETEQKAPHSLDSAENDTTEKELIEKEANDQIDVITSSQDEKMSEQTQTVATKMDVIETLENATEKDSTEETKDDNATNANNLEVHYTKVPATEEHDLTEEVEHSSELNEYETTTLLSADMASAATEEEDIEENSDKSGTEIATEVTIIQLPDSTESDEDVYIKLGETTTKATEKLNKEVTSSLSITEEGLASTEADFIETTTTRQLELEPQNVPESLTVDDVKTDEKLVEKKIELPDIAAAEPSKKVVVISVEPTTQYNKPTVLAQSISVSTLDKQTMEKQTGKPIEEFVTQQRPQQMQLNADYRPDPQNPTDTGDLTSYMVPKFPISPVLAALSKKGAATSNKTANVTTTKIKFGTPTRKPIPTSTKRVHTLKPVSYYNKHGGFSGNAPKPVEPTKVIPYSANVGQQRPMMRPIQLNNLMATSTQATRPPVKMEASPANSKGLEASVSNLDEDLQSFVKLCNELAFSYWKSITAEKISSARSLVMSPFALTSMLSMVFLGARGGTSGEMNEVLKLDDMVTFNPHLIFRNITDSVECAADSDIATAAFVREIFSDRANGKILQFFKEKTQQFYAGHVEEVNFNVVNDVIRRRTNLLVKRHTMGKVLEYLRTNSLWVNGPLAIISANLFQTDCHRGSTHLTDGEMFFQVHPSVRQRRLIPIPAVLYNSGFTAGYEPILDATIVAFGSVQDTVSTIYVMPGHQSTLSQAESLERLEHDLVEQAISKNAWSNILTALMDRPGMEVQLPRFSHRSFVNASLGLQKMGLKGLFQSDFADLRGLTGSSNRDIYLSDVIQINTFSICGEEKIGDNHHVEMYPAPPLRKRNKDLSADDVNAGDDGAYDSSEAIIDFGSLVHDSALARSFYDDLLDPKYLELPLSLRPRQARLPDVPRLRFDKPFLYFVRHNPTGIILFMGRFNPRLLP
ncbi:serine-rich adhesin for platelets [Eurosta solidaginis]|uniref:serine-rich adhesin for platelets n=1 Tax=Eurosta solidaginis TaxID=178769 RepID=UPI00353144C8